MAQYIDPSSGQVINVLPGQMPPAGAIPLPNGAPTGTSTTADPMTSLLGGGSIASPQGGLSAGAFTSAAATPSAKSLTIKLGFNKVYGTPTSAGSANAAEYHAVEATPEQFNEQQAYTAFGSILSDPGLMKQWQDIALKNGLVDSVTVNDATKLADAWNSAVRWALNMKAASGGQIDITPFQAANMVGQNTGAALLAQSNYAATHFTGTKTETISTVDTKQSMAMDDTLHRLLGRNPTPGELAAYQHGLQQIAQQNPTTTKRATTYDKGQVTNIQDTITGGYDQAAAEQQAAAQASPEEAMNQQATTYYDALVKALGAAA